MATTKGKGARRGDYMTWAATRSNGDSIGELTYKN
jgi:hypothetical protein